jgi:hypothetical protein
MKKYDIAIAAVLGLVAVLIFHPLASLGVDQHHDGIMLKPALDVLSGQMLFRDTFTQYGPLTTYLHVLALWIEPSLLSLRLLTVAAYAGGLVFFYLAWRAFLPVSLSLLTGLFAVIYAPFYHPDFMLLPWSSALALFFQAVVVFALTRIIAGRPAAIWAWVLGMACACTFWCRQPVGVCLTATLVVIAFALSATGWRHPEGDVGHIWARAMMGLAVVSGLILGYLAMNGAAGAWWDQNIVWPGRWAAADGDDMIAKYGDVFLNTRYALGLCGVFAAVYAPVWLHTAGLKLPKWTEIVWVETLMAVYVFFARDSVRLWLLLPEGGWNLLIIGLIVLNAVWVLLVSPPVAWTQDKG